jgi:hypothetical protein
MVAIVEIFGRFFLLFAKMLISVITWLFKSSKEEKIIVCRKILKGLKWSGIGLVIFIALFFIAGTINRTFQPFKPEWKKEQERIDKEHRVQWKKEWDENQERLKIEKLNQAKNN